MSGRANRQIDTERLLYVLEQQHGVEAQFYSLNSLTPNYETGTTGTSYSVKEIKRLISFTYVQDMKFEYDLSYLAANKNFAYGGIYVPGDRKIILRNNVVSSVKMKDHFIIEGKRFEIINIQDAVCGWIIQARNTPNIKRQAVVKRTMIDRLNVSEDYDVQ